MCTPVYSNKEPMITLAFQESTSSTTTIAETATKTGIRKRKQLPEIELSDDNYEWLRDFIAEVTPPSATTSITNTRTQNPTNSTTDGKIKIKI